MENFYRQLEILPANLANHLKITVIPLAIGISVSLPLAVLAVKHPRLRYPTLTAVSIVQTIPSLALLALMVPVLAGLSAVSSQAFGFEISALGFYPSVIALTLYSMLPVTRNAVTGIVGVEPSLVEAARGIGMTPRQVLFRVELPLAAPVMIAGIRTATVWVVGIATLATPVGQRCLGNYIFRGLQTRNWTAVLFGCVTAAALAILLDLLIGGIERAVERGRRNLGLLGGGAVLLVLITGIVAPDLARWTQGRGGAPADAKVIRVGSKTFTEQYILATVLTRLLEDEGFVAREKESLGSTVIFDALAEGEIDAYVDYTGTIWANYMDRQKAAAPEEVTRQVTDWLLDSHGIHALGTLGFENAYALAMRREQAERLEVRTVADLAEHAPEMKIGGDYEFFGRPEWRRIREEYGLSFADQISYDSTFMYEAVARGKVDVISAFTTDGRIDAFGLVLLDDPKDAIPPYDALLLVSGRAARSAGLRKALSPLIDAISVEEMRQANYMVDREEGGKTTDEAASWLRKHALE